MEMEWNQIGERDGSNHCYIYWVFGFIMIEQGNAMCYHRFGQANDRLEVVILKKKKTSLNPLHQMT